MGTNLNLAQDPPSASSPIVWETLTVRGYSHRCCLQSHTIYCNSTWWKFSMTAKDSGEAKSRCHHSGSSRKQRGSLRRSSEEVHESIDWMSPERHDVTSPHVILSHGDEATELHQNWSLLNYQKHFLCIVNIKIVPICFIPVKYHEHPLVGNAMNLHLPPGTTNFLVQVL